MKYTKEMIKKASLFAREAHLGQFRKGEEGIPYIVHPIAVFEILRRSGASVEAQLAGILHDVVEDTNHSLEDISSRFGTSISSIVDFVSEEDKSLSWKKRKIAYIERLKKAPFDAVFVSAADKLHNLRSTLIDYEIHGEEVWSMFNSKKDGQFWFYSTLIDLFEERGVKQSLVEEMRSIVEEIKLEYV